MSMPGMSELIVILIIVVLLFGAKKIPELAKGVGKGIKEFKGAMREEEETKSEEKPKEIHSANGDEKGVVKTATQESKEA